MNLEQERLNDFQARMNEWVSKQGLLFQLRYAGNLKGAESNLFHTLGQLFLRFVLLVVLVALGFGWYLVNRIETKGFRSKLEASLVKNLVAEELEVKGVSRKRGMFKLGAVNMIGEEGSAFEDLELRGVQTLMGLTDGFLKPWSGDLVEINRLTAFVKGGANSDELAAEAYDSLFWSSDQLMIRTIIVAETNLKWGYSKSNQGHVIGSKMVARRKGEGWNVILTGGKFSQNWFRDLTLERMELELSPGGFHIHEARLKKGATNISFTLKKVGGGLAPEFEGKGTIHGAELTDLIGEDYLTILSGVFSGDFSVYGSTNKQTGFKFLVDARMEEEDRIELKDGISLLRAISTADYLRSYRKVRLTEGGFRLATEPGKIEIENINLVASRLMRLEGGFSIRPPKADELSEDSAVAKGGGFGDLEQNDQVLSESAFLFTLRKAAELTADERKGSDLLGKKSGNDLNEKFSSEKKSRELRRLYLDGKVRMGILASSFERAPRLVEEFPVDEATELRWLDLNWDGESPFEVGDELSKKIFELSAAVNR